MKPEKRRFVQIYQWLFAFAVLAALLLSLALPGYALQSFVDEQNVTPTLTNAPLSNQVYDLMLDTRGAVAEVITNTRPAASDASPARRHPALF